MPRKGIATRSHAHNRANVCCFVLFKLREEFCRLYLRGVNSSEPFAMLDSHGFTEAFHLQGASRMYISTYLNFRMQILMFLHSNLPSYVQAVSQLDISFVSVCFGHSLCPTGTNGLVLARRCFCSVDCFSKMKNSLYHSTMCDFLFWHSSKCSFIVV